MKKEKGFTAIEVIVALALLGIIAVAFLGGLTTASKAIFIADERTTAESLARTEMEYVKSCNYEDLLPYLPSWSYEIPGGNPPWDSSHDALPAGYEGYSVAVEGNIFDANEDGVVDENDNSIQKITVVIYHPYDAIHPNENIVITLEDYKVDR